MSRIELSEEAEQRPTAPQLMGTFQPNQTKVGFDSSAFGNAGGRTDGRFVVYKPLVMP